jgi:hypothetical protein
LFDLKSRAACSLAVSSRSQRDRGRIPGPSAQAHSLFRAPDPSSDIVSRILAAELIRQVQQIIIDNHSGAVQTIGTGSGRVVRAHLRTSCAIVLKLNARINMALQSAVLKERYAAIDAERTGGTPEAFAAYVKKEKRGPMSSENPAPRLTRG